MLSPLEAKYMKDNTFRSLVQMLEHMIHTAQLTPMEVCEAAMLAAIHHEMRTVRPIVLSQNDYEAYKASVDQQTRPEEPVRMREDWNVDRWS